MALVTPSNLSTGCMVSAARWNQDIVANAQYLKGQAGSIAFESGGAFSGSMLVAGVHAITATGGNQRLLMGNSGGTGCPVLFEVSNGNLRIGVGTSFAGDGGTLTTKAFVSGSQMVLGASAVNANMTQGLTIQQGANDDEALALKSSDVAHGVTAQTETDTFGRMLKVSGNVGGLDLWGLTEAAIGLQLTGVETSGCTTRSRDTEAAIVVKGYRANGAVVASLLANENIFGVSNSASMRLLVDAEGDVHADAAVTASAYDTFNDLSLVRALELQRAPTSVVKDPFDAWVHHTRADLQRLRIATFNDHPGGDSSVWVNYSALTRLHSGALWQLHKRVVELEQRARPTLRDVLSTAWQWLTGPRAALTSASLA